LAKINAEVKKFGGEKLKNQDTRPFTGIFHLEKSSTCKKGEEKEGPKKMQGGNGGRRGNLLEKQLIILKG